MALPPRTRPTPVPSEPLARLGGLLNARNTRRSAEVLDGVGHWYDYLLASHLMAELDGRELTDGAMPTAHADRTRPNQA